MCWPVASEKFVEPSPAIRRLQMLEKALRDLDLRREAETAEFLIDTVELTENCR